MIYENAIKELSIEYLGDSDEMIQSKQVAVEALWTKIPAKVQIKDWSPARCPRCGKELSESLGDGYYKHYTGLAVCLNPDCCQRLDWGAEK